MSLLGRLTLVLLALVLAPLASYAQWTQLGNLSFRGEAAGTIYFIDEMNGYLGHDIRTGLAISKTTDGGATWRTAELPNCANCGFVSQIKFSSALIGWATVEANRVDTNRGEFGLGLFKTTDGGLTWVTQNAINDATSLFIRGNTIIVTNRRPAPPFSSIISRDGGNTWQPLPIRPSNDAAISQANRVVTTGFEDHGWARSADGGQNWQYMPANPESWSVYEYGGNFFAAPEQDARYRVNTSGGTTIYRSFDNGATWQQPYTFPFHMQGHIDGAAGALYVQMDMTQLMRSATPGLWRSDDNGTTWRPVNGPLGYWDRRFEVVGCVGGVVYATDNKGNIFKTRTGGDGTLPEPPFTLQFSDDTVSITSLVCQSGTTRIQFRNLYCAPDSVVSIELDNSPAVTSGAIRLDRVPPLPRVYGTDEGDYFDVRWDPSLIVHYDTTIHVNVRMRYYSTISGTFIDTVLVIAARARGEAPTAQVTSVFDFGQVPSCVPADSLMPIVNTGCDTLFINDPSIAGNTGITLRAKDGSTLNYPIVIPPGGNDTIMVHVDPQSVGPFSLNLRLPALHQRIAGQFDVRIQGEVVPTEAQFIVAFDSTSLLVDSTLLVRDTMTRCDPPQEFYMYVRNPGCVEVALRNAIFEGDGRVFAATIDGVVPDTLTGDDVARIRITVTPNGLGTINDQLRIRYKVGDNPSIDLFYPFTVHINYGTRILTMVDDLRDLDTIEYCKVRDTVILFQNTGCDTLTLTDASLLGPDFAFLGNQTLPRKIAPGAYDSVRVRYSPLLPGGASGQVSLVTDGDGDNDRTIDLLAAALPTDTVTFRLVPERVIVNDNDTLNFDLYPDTTVSGKGLRGINVTLTYNGDVLTYMDVEPKLAGLVVMPITELPLGPKMRQINLLLRHQNEIPLDSLLSLVALKFRTTLSDSSHVTMELIDVRLNDGDVNFAKCTLGAEKASSKLDLTLFCGDSLIKKTLIHGRLFLSTMQPRPNPSSKSANGELTIPYKVGAASKLSLRVFSYTGKLEYETLIDAHAGEGALSVPMRELGSGAHYYELRAGEALVRGQFVVTK